MLKLLLLLLITSTILVLQLDGQELDMLITRKNELAASLETSLLDGSAEQVKMLKLQKQQLNVLDLMLNHTQHLLADITAPELTYDQVAQLNVRLVDDIQDLAFVAQRDFQAATKIASAAVNDEQQAAKESSSEVQQPKNAIVAGVMKQFDKSVDHLEEQIQGGERKFDDGKLAGKLETVVNLGDDTDKSPKLGTAPQVSNSTTSVYDKVDITAKPGDKLPADNSAVKDVVQQKSANTLMNSQNDQFVLMRSNDLTAHIVDSRLFHDVIYLLMGAFCGGLVFDLFKFPAFFGYISAGIALGHTGLNVIKSVVQVETLAQFGVLLILFALGLEFSTDKIRKHWRISALGGTLSMLMVTIAMMLMGALIQLPLLTLFFVGVTVSLSSTTLVMKCTESRPEHTVTQAAMGILVLQDLFLGLLLAALPYMNTVDTKLMLGNVTQVFVYSTVFVMVSILAGKWLIVPALTRMNIQTAELQMLSTLAVCFTHLLVADHFGVSTEVAVFVAGVSLNNMDHERLRVDAVRDLFGALFFATLGMHIYPAFLLAQAPILIFTTMTIMAVKFLCALVALNVMLKVDARTAASIALGLSQVSEFAFILAARAKQMDLLNKEAYYILLGSTSISLLVTPVLWSWIFSKHVPIAERRLFMSGLRRRGTKNSPLLPVHNSTLTALTDEEESTGGSPQSDNSSVHSRLAVVVHKNNE